MGRVFNGNGPCPLIYEELLAYRLLPNASIYIASANTIFHFQL